jgi:sec-independent protein translocase protein TatB
MNIFSNIGVTELVLILLLALLVVGPERLPELARKLGKTLRDVRKAYENLTKDLGPELRSIQQTTQELRNSVEAVRSIPQDMVQSIAKAADLDTTVAELKSVTGSLDGVGQTLTDAGKMVSTPIAAAVNTTASTLPASLVEAGEAEDQVGQAEAAEATEARDRETEELAGPAVGTVESDAVDDQAKEQPGE